MLVFSGLATFPVFAAPLVLDTNTELSTAGYFTLSWQADNQGAPYTLQQSSTDTFLTPQALYSGSDTASVLSGYANGTYHFRVLDRQGLASNVVTVRVSHHSLTKAFSFFALGAVMFVILVAVLVTASQKEDAS